MAVGNSPSKPSLPSAPRLFLLLSLLGLACYAASVLSATPCVGVADNLDFFRVAEPAGIVTADPPPQRPGRFVQCEYELTAPDLSRWFSSAALAAWLARFVPFPASPGSIAVQQVGILWLAIWLCLVAYFVRAGRSPILLLAIFVVLVDPGYLLFWNSLYADAALILALAGSLAWMCWWPDEPARGKAGGWFVPAGLLLALAFFGSWSKMQYVLFALVLLLGVVPTVLGDPRDRKMLLVLGIGLIGLSATAAWHFFAGSGPRFPWANNYHAAFAGIATVAAEPEEALASLGVSAAHRQLPRRDVFSARIAPDHPVHSELANLSRWKLLWLYLKDPRAMAGALSRVEDEMARGRTHTRGNFPRSAERPKRSRYEPRWRFSTIRASLLQRAPPALWVFLSGVAIAAGVALFWQGGRFRARAAPVLFLVLWFVSQVVVVILGDGFVAFEQHLLGARLALDLLIALVLAYLGMLVVGSAKRWWPRPAPASPRSAPS